MDQRDALDKIEKALKERDDAKSLIRSVLDQSKAVIYIKDLEGRTTFASGQYCRIFDMSLDQILGKTDFELFPEDLAKKYRANDLHVQETGSHLEFEETAAHADGTKHIYISLKFPIFDSEGKLYGVGGVSTDITQFRSLEDQLNRAKRIEAVGLLAGGIAHDFNNVLGTILLQTDTMLMKLSPTQKEWRKAIESVKSAAQTAARLTHQLLAFGSRPVSSPRPIDLRAMLKGTHGILKNALGEDIRFIVEAPAGLWLVAADPSQMEQVLSNLCFNARDAMPTGGVLKVRAHNVTRASADFVELEVTDSGTGIEPEILDRIFEPFFSTKKESQRRGLGLATVYNIVQSLLGEIQVESQPGKGTTFRIFFPRAVRTAAKRKGGTPIGTERSQGSETVMLIEDEADLRKITAKLLTERGYKVIESKNGRAALALWKKQATKIDLVVTDIVMPGLSGIEVARKMKQSNSRKRALKILFVSAYSAKRLSEYKFKQGEYHFLEKPFTANEFLTKLREILDG